MSGIVHEELVFSYPLIIFWGALTLGITSAIGWAFLKIADATDPKGPKARVGPAGRWEGRTLDQIWYWYYLIHIPITLCLDTQSVFPQSWIPAFLKEFTVWYKAWSRDPVIINAGTGSREWAWLDVFLRCELGVQVPCFILGAWWLRRNDKRAYPLTLIYAAHTATTVAPVLYYLLTDTATSPALTQLEIGSLLASYLPFLLVPLGMIIDMFVKVSKLARQAARVEVLEKAESKEVDVIESKKRR